ncbi:MAG: hypothetical protein AB7P69_23235 [Candidatus Binatia bacterium]
MVLAAYGMRLPERELRQRTGWQEQFGVSSRLLIEIDHQLVSNRIALA